MTKRRIFVYSFFSIFLVFLFGFIISWIRNKLSNIAFQNFYFFILYMNIYMVMCSIPTDIPLAINNMVSVCFFNVIILWFCSKINYFTYLSKDK